MSHNSQVGFAHLPLTLPMKELKLNHRGGETILSYSKDFGKKFTLYNISPLLTLKGDSAN